MLTVARQVKTFFNAARMFFVAAKIFIQRRDLQNA
jgi:hypothetical protein